MPSLNKTAELKYMTPKQFFWTYVPLALEASAAQKSGTLAVRVFGPGGGAWTIDLEHKCVEGGCHDDAGAWLDISSDNFENILTGRKIDTSDPLLSAGGDRELFGLLAAIVEPTFLTQRGASRKHSSNPR